MYVLIKFNNRKSSENVAILALLNYCKRYGKETKAKQSNRRSPGTANFADFKENNVPPRLCDFIFREIASMFWTTALIVFFCLFVCYCLLVYITLQLLPICHTLFYRLPLNQHPHNVNLHLQYSTYNIRHYLLPKSCLKLLNCLLCAMSLTYITYST